MKRLLLFAILLQACGKKEPAPSPLPYTDLRLSELTTNEREEADRLVDEAFAEALSKTPATAPVSEKVIRLHWWVHTHLYQVDPEPPLTTLKILQQRRGQCGSSSFVFQLLVSRLGLSTRSLGLFCIPRQNGHVGAEVFYDRAWHYFDPSFGVFFTTNGRIDGPVASLADIQAFPQLVHTNIFYPVSYGRLGWNYPPMKELALHEMFKRTQPGYEAAWGDYALFLANLCGSTEYVAGTRLELPYRVSLASESRHELGTVNGSFDDISLHYTGDRMYDATGQYVVGDSSSSLGPLVIEHRYIITGAGRGESIFVTLHRHSGASARRLRFKALGAMVDEIDYLGDDTVVVSLRSRSATVELLSHTEGDDRLYLDAVFFERIPQ